MVEGGKEREKGGGISEQGEGHLGNAEGGRGRREKGGKERSIRSLFQFFFLHPQTSETR
jgi:hypothetical protein